MKSVAYILDQYARLSFTIQTLDGRFWDPNNLKLCCNVDNKTRKVAIILFYIHKSPRLPEKNLLIHPWSPPKAGSTKFPPHQSCLLPPAEQNGRIIPIYWMWKGKRKLVQFLRWKTVPKLSWKANFAESVRPIVEIKNCHAELGTASSLQLDYGFIR